MKLGILLSVVALGLTGAIPLAAQETQIFGREDLVDEDGFPIDDGNADGWSGITVIETPIPTHEGANTGLVTQWNYITDDGRIDGVEFEEHHVTPLLIKYDPDDDEYTIVGVGAEHTPSEEGAQLEIPFGLEKGSAAFEAGGDTTYHIAVWQRREGVNNEAGGVIPFAGAGGPGMFQMDQDGTSYEPEVDDPVTRGHQSGEDGRNYSFNFVLTYDTEDADNDGMTDGWEVAHGLDPTKDDSQDDLDEDTVVNIREFENGTLPNNKDSDGDTLEDGVETNTGTFVDTNDTGTNPLSDDTDADGLNDNVETNTLTYVDPSNTGTSPHKADTDEDKFTDLEEIERGSDPTDKNSVPTARKTFIAGREDLVDEDGEAIDDGTPDGWSGLTVIETPIPVVDGQTEGQVTEWNYITSGDRIDGVELEEHHVTPVLVKYDPDADEYLVVGVGAEHTPNQDGAQLDIPFDVQKGSAEFVAGEDSTYHIAVWQRRDDVDDDSGGVIPFAGSGGPGMFQMNQDGTFYEPEVDDLVDRGHESGPGGRNYSFNFVLNFGAVAPPIPFQITEIAHDGATTTITWNSEPDKTYTVEYSPDLKEWVEETDGHESEGDSTSFTFDPAKEAPFYTRVREEGE